MRRNGRRIDRDIKHASNYERDYRRAGERRRGREIIALPTIIISALAIIIAGVAINSWPSGN